MYKKPTFQLRPVLGLYLQPFSKKQKIWCINYVHCTKNILIDDGSVKCKKTLLLSWVYEPLKEGAKNELKLCKFWKHQAKASYFNTYPLST